MISATHAECEVSPPETSAQHLTSVIGAALDDQGDPFWQGLLALLDLSDLAKLARTCKVARDLVRKVFTSIDKVYAFTQHAQCAVIKTHVRALDDAYVFGLLEEHNLLSDYSQAGATR